MKNKKIYHFWIPFIINIFVTSSITMFIISIGFIISSRLNIFNNEFINSFYGIMILLLVNITIAIIYTLIIIT